MLDNLTSAELYALAEIRYREEQRQRAEYLACPTVPTPEENLKRIVKRMNDATLKTSLLEFVIGGRKPKYPFTVQVLQQEYERRQAFSQDDVF